MSTPRVFAERYVVERALGAGGMGTVHLVRDRWRDERPCALKIVGEAALADPFRDALARVAAIHHPGLPAIHGCEDDPATGLLFATMDVCPGVSLDQAWPLLGPEARLGAVAATLRVLGYLHAHGVAHGDLSPGNVFSTTEDPPRASLLDAGGGGDPGTVSGTLPYLAPERLGGRPADPASDLFSLGAVLHEVLFCRPAWADYPRRMPDRGTPPAFRCDAHGSTPAMAEPADAPRWVRFLTPLLALDPEQRPADARAALLLLGRAFDRDLPFLPPDDLADVLARPAFVDPEGGRERLVAAARDAVAGVPAARRAAVVGGGAGRGRSRLLDEMRRDLSFLGVPTVTALGVSGDAPLALVRRLLARLGGAVPAGAADAAAGDVVHLVGRDATGERLRLVAAWTDALAAALADPPVAVLVDDVDRADLLSRDVLFTLARTLARATGAADGRGFLALATDARVAEGDDEARVVRVTRRDWRIDDARALLSNTLPGVAIPDAVVRTLHERSGGLPRLLVAQAEWLARAGLLCVTDARLKLERAAAEAALPATFDDLVGARVGALPTASAAILRTLALHPGPASGADVRRWLAADALGDGAPAPGLPAVAVALEELWVAGLLTRTESARGGFVQGVPSAAVRAAALAGVDAAARTRAHRAIGAALAADLPGAGDLSARRLAGWHLLAGSPDGEPADVHGRGAALAVEAARGLLADAAFEAAWGLLEHVRPDGLPPALRLDVLRAVGEAATFTGRYDEGLAALDRAVEEAIDAPGRAEGRVRAAHLLRRAGRYPEALDRSRAVTAAGDVPLDTRAAARAEEARIYLMQGDYDAAASAADEAAAAAPAGASGELARGHAADVRGLVALYRGAFAEALTVLGEARARFEAAGQPMLVATAASHEGLVHHRKGDVERAVASYRDAMRVAEEAGDRGQTWRFAMNIGVALQERADPMGALCWYQEALAQAELIDDRGGVLRVSTNLANIHRHLGKLDAAERLLARALPLAREHGDRLMEGYDLTLLGEVALLRSRHDEADLRLGEALTLFRELGCINEECEVRTDQAWLALDRAQPAQAAAEARAAIDLAARNGLDELRCRALVVRAEAERRRRGGDPGEIVSWLDEARALAGRTGKPEIAWWVGYHQFLALRDRGDAGPALEVGLGALHGLREQADRLPEGDRGAFLDLPPHARALAELGWLEQLTLAERLRTGGVWSDASLRRLLEVNKRLAEERDPTRLLEFILDSAILLTGAERGFLLLRPDDEGDAEDEALDVVVARNIDHETVRNRHNKVSHGIARHVLQSGESVLSLDAMEDERYRSYLSVHNLRLRSILCVPLRAATPGERDAGTTPVRGALYLDNRFRSGAFAEADLAALEAFADQACLALVNARLVADLERSRADLLQSQQRVEELNRKLEEELRRTESALRATEETVQRQRRALRDRNQFENIIGHSAALERVFGVLERVLDNDVPVLIQGESGTGKELIARAVHYCGARRDAEFVALNCASVPATLIESELFGHVRGAFTGADRDRRGVFEAAHRGTLLLDEVGDMPLEMQVKLLRALQSGEIQKVGDTRRVRVDVRVIAATNRDLRQLVAEGRFREDLFYRLNVVLITAPPLRERVEDIPLLVQHFIDENQASGLSRVTRARADVLRLLAAYEWPGNVRELATVVKNAVLFAEGDELTPQDLSNFPEILAAGQRGARRARDSEKGAIRPLAELEREAIIEALAHFGGNKKRTAEQLGIDRRTLYNKIAAYDIVLETSAKVR